MLNAEYVQQALANYLDAITIISVLNGTLNKERKH